MLNLEGNSCAEDRVDLLKRVVERLGINRIEALLADREFIGTQWFLFLIEQKIPFESITPDMLTAPPKREREPGEGRSELAEVLDAAAAKRREDRDRKNRDGKSGGGRRSSTGSGSASAPRGERKSSGGERRDGQKPRHDSPRPQQSAVVPVEANAANESPADAERRRNRRRRKPRGERVEASGTAAIQQPITAEIPLVSDQAPFFSRLKQKIKQIVQRLPMPGRRR